MTKNESFGFSVDKTIHENFKIFLLVLDVAVCRQKFFFDFWSQATSSGCRQTTLLPCDGAVQQIIENKLVARIVNSCNKVVYYESIVRFKT